MIEQDIEAIINKEIEHFTYAHPIDVKCFKDHLIKPQLIRLCLDLEGKEWKECYLVTDHNGIDDSPYRAAYDPEHGMFVREITLEDGTPLYLGRYKSLECFIDQFA